MIGLLDLRVIFFMLDCVAGGSGCFDGGGAGSSSFFVFTVGFESLRLRLIEVASAAPPFRVGGDDGLGCVLPSVCCGWLSRAGMAMVVVEKEDELQGPAMPASPHPVQRG
jgi:hypothetical protein